MKPLYTKPARIALCLDAAAEMRAFAAGKAFMSSARISAMQTARLYVAAARAHRLGMMRD